MAPQLNQLSNATTDDDYNESGGATISDPQAVEPFVAVELDITGAAVYYEVEETPGKWSPDETFSPPRVGVLALGVAYGIKFRSALAGAPAQVSARMLTASQVRAAGGLGSFGAPAYVVDPSGGVSPIASNMIASLENQLAADVDMVNANTWYDGPALNLPAGTWLVIGTITVDVATSASIGARIFDGATTYASAEQDRSAAGASALTVAAIVKLNVASTVRIQGINSHAGNPISAAMPSNSVGDDNASTIVAVQLS